MRRQPHSVRRFLGWKVDSTNSPEYQIVEVENGVGGGLFRAVEGMGAVRDILRRG